MSGYPIELELRGKRALVVGLGPVGRRRVAGLVAAGARVLGVDPAGWVADLHLPAGAEFEIRAEPYRSEHLREVSLAFAAAPAAVNRAVVLEARRAEIWVGSATDPGEGDFTVPAVWREGPLILTVSTSGASPALAAALRDRAAGALGSAAAGLASLLAELRPEVLARLGDRPEARRRVMADWGDPRWLDLWMAEGPAAVRRALGDRLEREQAGTAIPHDPAPGGSQGPDPDRGGPTLP